MTGPVTFCRRTPWEMMAFAVIRAAMAATGKGATDKGGARLVMGGRERAVPLLPRLDGIVMWTLRYGDEVRGNAEFVEKADAGKAEEGLPYMVCKLTDAGTKGWSPDLVQENLRALIEAKKGRKKRPAAKTGVAAKGGNVMSIMDALKQSLAGETKRQGGLPPPAEPLAPPPCEYLGKGEGEPLLALSRCTNILGG